MMMDKKLISVAVLLGLVVSPAKADMLTLKAGADMWFADGTVRNVDSDHIDPYFYFALEHFIPLVPNARISNLNVDNNVIRYNRTDFTLYYQVLDNEVAGLDLGVTLSDYESGRALNESFDGHWVPSLYGDIEVALPADFAFFTTINAGGVDGTTMFDGMAGVKWDVPFSGSLLNVRTGYRYQENDFDFVQTDGGKSTVDGVFLGVGFEF